MWPGHRADSPREHPGEDRTGIGSSPLGPQRRPIIDPRVDDLLRPAVMAKEQSEPSADPGAPPKATAWAERVAPGRILRDNLQHLSARCVVQPDVRIGCELRRIDSLCALELAQLVDEAVVEQQRPSVALHQRSTSPSMSSSGSGSHACLSMSRARSPGSVRTCLRLADQGARQWPGLHARRRHG